MKIKVDISILETVPNQIQIRRFRAIVKVEIVLFETVAIQISTRIRIRVNIILLHGGNPWSKERERQDDVKTQSSEMFGFFPRMAGHDRPGDRPDSNLHA